MGANFDTNFIIDPKLKMTDEDLEAAAETIFEDSAYHNGHGGYTGSLAEKTGGGVSIHRDIQFMNADKARRYVEENLDDDKWDQPHVVPVIGKGWFIGGWCSC